MKKRGNEATSKQAPFPNNNLFCMAPPLCMYDHSPPLTQDNNTPSLQPTPLSPLSTLLRQELQNLLPLCHRHDAQHLPHALPGWTLGLTTGTATALAHQLPHLRRH